MIVIFKVWHRWMDAIVLSAGATNIVIFRGTAAMLMMIFTIVLRPIQTVLLVRAVYHVNAVVVLVVRRNFQMRLTI